MDRSTTMPNCPGKEGQRVKPDHEILMNNIFRHNRQDKEDLFSINHWSLEKKKKNKKEIYYEGQVTARRDAKVRMFNNSPRFFSSSLVNQDQIYSLLQFRPIVCNDLAIELILTPQAFDL